MLSVGKGRQSFPDYQTFARLFYSLLPKCAMIASFIPLMVCCASWINSRSICRRFMHLCLSCCSFFSYSCFCRSKKAFCLAFCLARSIIATVNTSCFIICPYGFLCNSNHQQLPAFLPLSCLQLSLQSGH